jgi:PKD repeat protein
MRPGIFGLKLLSFFTFVSFCATGLSQLGLATTYYVATNGNDSYNGLYPSYQSAGNGPFRTLGHAADKVQAGDTVQIRAGTYQERVNWSRSGTAANRITITNYNSETVIIDGGYALPGGSVYNFLVMVSGDYVTLQNIAITRSSGGLLALTGDYSYVINVIGNGSRETGMVAGGNHNLLDGCSMTDNGNGFGQNGQTTWGTAIDASASCTNIIVQNCVSYNNRGEGLGIYGTYGVMQDCIAYDNRALNVYIGGSHNTVKRNIVYCSPGNYYSGIVMGAEKGDSLVGTQIINNLCLGNWLNLVSDSNVTTATDWIIAYNTFVNSQKTSQHISAGYDMGVYFRTQLVHFSNSIFKNNIVMEEPSNQIPINSTLTSSHAGFTFSNNCWNKIPTAAAQGTGDVIADPLLAKTGSTGPGLLTPAYFKILENSPAKDRATAIAQVTEDFFRTPRGTAPDIGAHEFTNTTPSLIASATGAPTSGQAPLTVNFMGSATGGTPPYSYRWAFGAGGSSTAQYPSYTYSSAGTYTATLTVTDSKNATSSKSLSITVTAAAPQLVANASASPSSGQAPLTVSFTGSATGGTSPYSYRWTFGDGGSSTTQSPAHTYSSAGSYTATLTVTDSKNATSNKSLIINVTTSPSRLTAIASADPTSGLTPLIVNFTGSGAGGSPPYSYKWNFGDGSSSSAQNPSHTYSAIGNYTATLTVTDSASTNANAALNISVGSVSTANLALAAETGAPAPGQGGTTDPSPGNYFFSIGSIISLKSIPNSGYRFSRWTGDIAQSSTFSAAITLTMDKNKSLSATFCTQCADVNGDLKITPGDAQLAFDIYLGKISNATWCQLENADIKCDGTKFSPKVTPADAQMIFNKYLKKGVVNSDCSGNSRTGTLLTQNKDTTKVNLTINDMVFIPGQEIVIPVIIESPSGIKAFGFDLSFPSDVLTYVGLERTELTIDYEQLDANVLSPQRTHRDGAKADSIVASKNLMPQSLDNREPGGLDQSTVDTTGSLILRVGGYKTKSAVNPSFGVLVALIFIVTGEVKDPKSISVAATYDDIQNATIRTGMINRQNNSQNRENRGPGENLEKKLPGKRPDF